MLLIAEIERCKTNEAGTVRSEKMRSWLRCLKKLNVLLPLPEFLIRLSLLSQMSSKWSLFFVSFLS